MANGQLIERLRRYLRELKPEAQAMLIAELERALLRGEDTDGAELVLRELRRNARDSGRSAMRGGNLQRMFFQPLEPFLVDDIATHHHPGRIARVALDPIWQWIARDLLPGEVRAVSEEITRIYSLDDPEPAQDLARVFQDRAALRMHEAIASARDDEKLQRRLAGQIGTPRALDDAIAILQILAARDALEAIAIRIPSHIKALSGSLLDDVKALLDEPQIAEQELFLPSLLIVMSRLAAPWQLVRLAAKAQSEAQSELRAEDEAEAGETPYTVAVAIILAETERMIGELKAELKTGRGIAPAALLKAIHDGLLGLRTELTVFADAPSAVKWHKRAGDLRAEVSTLLKSQIECMPGRICRLLRPKAAGDIAPGSVLDSGDILETESLIDFAGGCRPFAAEFGIREITERAFADAQRYLHTTAPLLAEALQVATERERAFRKSQFDAAMRFGTRIFGPGFAESFAGSGAGDSFKTAG